MKNEVILELAARWEREAKRPEFVDGAPEAELINAKTEGAREQLRACADCLRMLVQILG